MGPVSPFISFNTRVLHSLGRTQHFPSISSARFLISPLSVLVFFVVVFLFFFSGAASSLGAIFVLLLAIGTDVLRVPGGGLVVCPCGVACVLGWLCW